MLISNFGMEGGASTRFMRQTPAHCQDLNNKINTSPYLSVNVFSVKHKLGTLYRPNWNLEMLVIEC